MANCVTCKTRCENAGQHRVKSNCISYKPKDYPKSQTNANRIRAMNDDELAEWLSCNCIGDGYSNSAKDWLNWLKQEVEK